MINSMYIFARKVKQKTLSWRNEFQQQGME